MKILRASCYLCVCILRGKDKLIFIYPINLVSTGLKPLVTQNTQIWTKMVGMADGNGLVFKVQTNMSSKKRKKKKGRKKKSPK